VQAIKAGAEHLLSAIERAIGRHELTRGHWPRPEPTRKISPDNRIRRQLPARMEHGRSCLMDECQVMASDGERLATTITPTLVPS